MRPSEYIDAIYNKDNRIQEVEQADAWVPIYLNKIFIQNSNNAVAMSKAMEYCLYISPTFYFYLLYMLIPKQVGVRYIYPKKKEEKAEDKLIEKIKHVLGWSTREFDLNKKQIETTILNNRQYWEEQLGVQNERPSKARK